MKRELLRISNLYKQKYQNMMLNNVNINVLKSEIVSVLSNKNDDKAALADILGGIEDYNSGSIYFNEKKTDIRSRSSSLKHGIHVIDGSVSIIDNLTVGENIFFYVFTKKPFVDYGRINKYSMPFIKLVGLDCTPNTPVSVLNPLEKLKVRFASVLMANPRLIVINDAPFLPVNLEKSMLERIARHAKKSGISILYLTANTENAIAASDRIIVLKNGIQVGEATKQQKDFNYSTTDKIMKGWGRHATIKKVPQQAKYIDIKNLSTKFLDNLSFYALKDEILGICDPLGYSSMNLLESIYGFYKKSSGDIYIEGEKVSITNTTNASKAGIAFYSPDYRQSSLLPELTVKENLSLTALKKTSHLGIISASEEKYYINYYLDKFEISNKLIHLQADTLDSCEQHKMQLIQCLMRKPKTLLLYEPLRDIDLATRTLFLNIFSEQSKQGTVIIMATSSPQEGYTDIAHRFLILNNKTIQAEFNADEIDNIFSVS